MDFISTKSVLDNAIGRGMISVKEYQTFKSYLNTYDQSLDGKKDGGFFKGQIGADTYVQIGHPVQGVREKVKKVNKLAIELLYGDRVEKKKTLAEAAKEAGIFGAKVVWATINPAACGGDGDISGPECGENCGIDLCYENDNGDIICGCREGEVVMQDCHEEEECVAGPYGSGYCYDETVCDDYCE